MPPGAVLDGCRLALGFGEFSIGYWGYAIATRGRGEENQTLEALLALIGIDGEWTARPHPRPDSSHRTKNGGAD
jgi:hypothetical protein